MSQIKDVLAHYEKQCPGWRGVKLKIDLFAQLGNIAKKRKLKGSKESVLRDIRAARTNTSVPTRSALLGLRRSAAVTT
jgi:hypothetical protein